MQNTWKKVGAVLGSAVMIGATLAGAALAQGTKDLGDLQELLVVNGQYQGLYAVGANAATADVVSAINMGGWAGGLPGTGSTSGSGEVTLTPITSEVEGMERHVEFDNWANVSKEFGAGSAATDVIGPEGYASGDNIVNFVYSHNEKGPIYVGGQDFKWNEEIAIDLTTINAFRDNLESSEGDLYDEVFLAVNANSMAYSLKFATAICDESLQGKKIWFMGKEYTVIAADMAGDIKLGASDAEVLLTTANPTTTMSGIDVTLEGVYSVGTGNAYQAKITVTNGGRTETKFINNGGTDSIAGIEIFVKTAAVTTSGTNEGEAQVIVGAGILKLQDGDYLTRGDGSETNWRVDYPGAGGGVGCGIAGLTLDELLVTESYPHTSLTGDNPVLSPGDEVLAPNSLFSLMYNGATDQYGNEMTYRTVNLQPTVRDLGSGNMNTIRIRTPDSDAIEFTTGAPAVRKVDNEIWVNVSENDNAFYWRDTSTGVTQYLAANNPRVKLTTSKELTLNWTTDDQISGFTTAGDGVLTLTEPALEQAGTVGAFTVEYDVDVAKFDDLSDDDAYAALDSTGALGLGVDYVDNGTDEWTGRTTGTTRNRDIISPFGTMVTSTNQYGITIESPLGQSWAEFVVGISGTQEGAPITVGAGETATIGGTTIEVEGAIAGSAPVNLPTTIGKLDTQVTSADKSSYVLMLVGGPKVNTLVNELQVGGKLTKTITNVGEGGDVSTAGAGVVELVANAWDTNKYALVIAGADRDGTSKASNVISNYDSYKAQLDGQMYYIV